VTSARPLPETQPECRRFAHGEHGYTNQKLELIDMENRSLFEEFTEWVLSVLRLEAPRSRTHLARSVDHHVQRSTPALTSLRIVQT
jgi:hypothetical protein